MDKLDEIFALQKSFQDRIKVERKLQELPMEAWIQKQSLAMMSEMAELLEEVNFKWWKNPHELNINAIQDELSDIMHFFVSMCLEAGMTADDLHQRYISKNKENHDRQDGTSAKKGYCKEGQP